MWVTAIVLGVASSLHCVGMCSPLMLAVTTNSSRAIYNRLAYNAGRIIMYGVLGMLVASIGSLLPIQRYQNVVSLTLGAAMILIALLQINVTRLNYLTSIAAPVTVFLKQQFAFFLKQRNYFSVTFLGMLNGLLPCGMTLIAMTNCLVLAGPIDGFNFMILFGLGTLPAMMGFATLLMIAIKKCQLNFRKITVALIGVSGVLLIVRVFLHAGVEAHATGRDFADIVLCR